jgi:hypothetical protein
LLMVPALRGLRAMLLAQPAMLDLVSQMTV